MINLPEVDTVLPADPEAPSGATQIVAVDCPGTTPAATPVRKQMRQARLPARSQGQPAATPAPHSPAQRASHPPRAPASARREKRALSQNGSTSGRFAGRR